MEPEDNSDYHKQEYWDARYKSEKEYDWFASVYKECVARIVSELFTRFVDGKQQKQTQKFIRVLHLGCGNSRLTHDLASAWAAQLSETNLSEPALLQTAIDYSPVVIENMRKNEGDQPVGPPTRWLVADMRNLESIVPKQQSAEEQLSPELFDCVIDKGTMDALQADKDRDGLEEDIDAMMKETSRVLRGGAEDYPGGIFIQVSWEPTTFRKHWCLRDEYGWNNDEFLSKGLGADAGGCDCLYRMFRYVKKNPK